MCSLYPYCGFPDRAWGRRPRVVPLWTITAVWPAPSPPRKSQLGTSLSADVRCESAPERETASRTITYRVHSRSFAPS